MGELSARETLINNASMKTDLPSGVIENNVDALIKSFGLSHVADNSIGTVFKRGLSGGQRKRVEVCSELIAPHSVIFLDEPTSGLDGAIAYDVLSATRKILESKNKTLSLIISIHQPNSRILELFDHVLLLGGGGSLFFGTVPESVEYFTRIGFPPPAKYTPTDVYLQVSDSNFGENQDFDFEGTFACSPNAAALENLLNSVTRSGMKRALASESTADSSDQRSSSSIKPIIAPDAAGPHSGTGNTFFRQYATLVKRDFTIAYRDPSLYYLQFILVSFFGFLVGSCFYSVETTIAKSSDVSGGLLWIVMMMCYIQVFKVYHLSRSDQRVRHEISNNTYFIMAYWLSELTTTMIMLLSFLPGTIIAYFMMGLPSKAYPFLLFLFWMTAVTAESMLNFITKFSSDATVSIVSSQAVLVVLTIFGGGMFIPWNKCPDYWFWLQELSVFTQASRAAIMNVADHLDYDCATPYGPGMCFDSLGKQYTCIPSSITDTSCRVGGRDVLHTLQGTITNESKWIPFGYLVLIFAVMRLSLIFLMYYPVDKLKYLFDNWRNGIVMRGILDTRIALRRVQGQVNSYIALRGASDKQESDNSSSKMFHDSAGSAAVAVKQSSIETVDFSVPLTGNEDAIARGSCLVWNNLSVILKGKGTKLIDNVSGVAFPGRILALMGPSGAGKTTLLNALSNRAPYAKLVGDVTFGKRPFTAADLVYVPQFDEFNQNLTVYETIELVGLLKCKDADAMRRRLGNLLSILGLAPKVNTLCKELTSGELKRVSVGMGMISNPNVLFLGTTLSSVPCHSTSRPHLTLTLTLALTLTSMSHSSLPDEPTTGLDSSAAYSIVKYLSELSAATNVVVIMTIHQPAQIVFDMLQDLYLMETGRLAFFGPSSATQDYFASKGFTPPEGINAVDFYLDLVSKAPEALSGGGAAQMWSELYYDSGLSINYNALVKKTVGLSEAAGNPPEQPSHLTRLGILSSFFGKYYIRDVGFYYLRLAFLIIIALFVGTVFLLLETNTDNLPKYSGAIFFNIWAVLFSAVSATGLLAADRRIAVEQVKNAIITPSVYCLAQFSLSLPFNFVISLIYQCIFHWLINMNPRGETFIYAVLITLGHLLLMEAIMLTVVAVLKNAMLSVTFAMVVLGYLFLFSGFFIIIKDMPKAISWVSYITPTRVR